MEDELLKKKIILTFSIVLFFSFSLALVSAGTPTIVWEDPTPTNGGVHYNTELYLNTTITDDNETSAFFDWDNEALGFWNFESLNSTGVYDNSSNSNFMSYGVSGPSASDLINGTRGHAMVFDGVNDYIKTTNVVVSNPTELTIASWLYKTADGPSYECALHHATSTTIGSSSYWLGVSNDNLLTATIGANSGAPGGWSAGRTTQLATYGEWWHIAAVWNGADVVVYLNGVYNKDYALTTYNTLTTDTRIGASSDGANYQYKGVVDEVLIVERALSANEIGALYNNSEHRLSANITGLESGTYNYSAYVIDEDGNINISTQNVTISIPITPTPEINSSEDTDTSDEDLNCYDAISNADGSKFNATVRWYKDDVLNLTMEYDDNYVHGDTIISVLNSGNTSTGDVWKCDMKYYDGTSYSPVGTSDDLLIVELDPPVITWEDPTPDTETSTLNDWVYLNTTITDFSDTSSFFDWNNSLLGYWSMDASNGTGIYDNSTNDNFGTYEGAGFGEDSLTTGKYGDSLLFDGVNDYVNLGDTANGDYDAMTVEAWIKRTSDEPSGWRTPLHRNDGTTVGSSVFFIGLEATSHHITTTIGAGASGPTYQSGGTNIVAELDTWYHVVNSWDGTTATVYVNGVEIMDYPLTSANFKALTATKGAAVTRIGASGDSTGYLFKGNIDEVKIYSRALSPEEINASYDNGVYKLYHNFTNLDLGTYDYSAYSIDVRGNLKVGESREIAVTDNTCTAPGSGNWGITCSDDCIWNSDFNVPGNITMAGYGTLTLNANMTFASPHWEIYKEDGCKIVVNSGGSIK